MPKLLHIGQNVTSFCLLGVDKELLALEKLIDESFLSPLWRVALACIHAAQDKHVDIERHALVEEPIKILFEEAFGKDILQQLCHEFFVCILTQRQFEDYFASEVCQDARSYKRFWLDITDLSLQKHFELIRVVDRGPTKKLEYTFVDHGSIYVGLFDQGKQHIDASLGQFILVQSLSRSNLLCNIDK